MNAVLLIHAVATFSMVGLIWFVQLVHYPLFAQVGNAEFVDYEVQHTRRTSWTVAMFMPAEAITAAWLVLDVPPGVSGELAVLGGVLVLALWISTAAWQAPIHSRLTVGYEPELQRRLVRSNWFRTVLWSARGGLVLVMLAQALG